MFSAYDLKKIIPRAIFALVIANLSWGLMGVAIDASNFLGDAAQALVMAPFAKSGLLGLSLGASSQGAFAAIAVVGGAGAVLGLIPILGVAVAGLFGLLFAFGIILLRRVALVGLIIIAPIAIALSVFPQTEKWAKQWWEWFVRLLLMYPFIMAFFGLSEVAAGIISRQGGGAGVQVVYDLAALAILIMPYFIIGKAFSLAGGVMGKLAGMVNNKDKGIIDKTKKWEAGKVAERRTDAKTGSRYGGRNRFTKRVNTALRDAAQAPKTVFRSQDTKDAVVMAAHQANVDSQEARHEALKTATKEELALGARISDEREAKDVIHRLAQKAARENGTTYEAEKAKLDATYASWKRKAGGSVDSASATYALSKAVANGSIGRREAELINEGIGAKLGGDASGRESATRVLNASLAPALAASGQHTSATLATTPGGPSMEDQVESLFRGPKALGAEQLGGLHDDTLLHIASTKNSEVSTVLDGMTNGTISTTDGVVELTRHRADAEVVHRAALKAGKTQQAANALALIQSIDQQIATSAHAAHAATVATDSAAQAASRVNVI